MTSSKDAVTTLSGVMSSVTTQDEIIRTSSQRTTKKAIMQSMFPNPTIKTTINIDIVRLPFFSHPPDFIQTPLIKTISQKPVCNKMTVLFWPMVLKRIFEQR